MGSSSDEDCESSDAQLRRSLSRSKNVEGRARRRLSTSEFVFSVTNAETERLQYVASHAHHVSKSAWVPRENSPIYTVTLSAAAGEAQEAYQSQLTAEELEQDDVYDADTEARAADDVDSDATFSVPYRPMPYYEVPRGVTLRFLMPAGSPFLYPSPPTLLSNYPTNDDQVFERNRFAIFPPTRPYDGEHDFAVDIWVDRPGAFEWYLDYDVNVGAVHSRVSHTRAQSYRMRLYMFVVHPIPVINGRPVDPESVVCMTVLPKALGTTDRWIDGVFRLAADLHYNAVHFTPIQQLGESGSSYSLNEQLSINDSFFAAPADSAAAAGRGAVLTHAEKESTLRAVLKQVGEDCGLLTVQDVVWNHTAHSSPWLREHPEAGYSTLHNSPHLIPAFELDQALQVFSEELVEGVHLPAASAQLSSLEDVQAVIKVFREVVWPRLKLWEFFVIDVEAAVAQFRTAARDIVGVGHSSSCSKLQKYGWMVEKMDPIQLLQTEGLQAATVGVRHSHKVILEVALAIFNSPRIPGSAEEIGASPMPHRMLDLEARCRRYTDALNVLNLVAYKKLDYELEEISRNLSNQIEYRFVAAHGPRLGRVTHAANCRLSEPYFTVLNINGRKVGLANNGWIYNANPLVDFASAESSAYLLRQVIIWGDCVKLRYGQSREDCPWLWDHMREYTEWTASLFDGIRIDNCHSTPIHLAQFLVDAARRVRPELFVVSELFTGSLELDCYYVSKLGINCLIREAMGAHDPAELARRVQRHSGRHPVGSLRARHRKQELVPQVPRAILYDCTHDNEAPAQKRTAEDAAANSALVLMASCAVGSNYGYDAMVPHNIDVVHESRRYPPPPGRDLGIMPLKRLLNQQHVRLQDEGFEEIHVHQHTEQTISVQRHHPQTHACVVMFARTAFSRSPAAATSVLGDPQPTIDTEDIELELPAAVTKPLMFFRLTASDPRSFVEDPNFINGLDCATVVCTDAAKIEDAFQITVRKGPHGREQTVLKPRVWPPGAVLIVEGGLFPSASDVLDRLAGLLADIDSLAAVWKDVTLVDMNVLLFRCDAEERATTGGGNYGVPGLDALPYCGLTSLADLLDTIRRNEDLGHALCNNLREGDWLLDWTLQRLSQRSSLAKVQRWLRTAFSLIKSLPRFLIPRYVDQVVTRLYAAARTRSLALMSPFVRTHPHLFVHELALTSVQLYGVVGDVIAVSGSGVTGSDLPSLAAGLEHFATGYMRTWGRDTFISLRGLFLVTGRLEEALEIILAFGCTLRHGLIPNLLGGGRAPRYNARDATWWWLQAIQDYWTFASEAEQKALLQRKITRFFSPVDDSDVPLHSTLTCTLAEAIQEVMQKHASGIHFRERNAGTDIDSKMTDEGFEVRVRADLHLNALVPQTGFLFGGNKHNCGTWMDKMGESKTAGNWGVPATPRDGSAVELVGLLHSTLRWLTKLASQGHFASTGVLLPDEHGGSQLYSYSRWASTIQASFEAHFWVPENPADDARYHCDPKYVNRRGIYRDTKDASNGWGDYQMRPNICIAMAVAPDLFDPAHMLTAVNQMEETLVGPLGMHTLDPQDWNYNGVYDNNLDGPPELYARAKGFNYHNGPEWLWPLGYFLRAKIHILASTNLTDALFTNAHSPYAKRRDLSGRRSRSHSPLSLQQLQMLSLELAHTHGRIPTSSSCEHLPQIAEPEAYQQQQHPHVSTVPLQPQPQHAHAIAQKAPHTLAAADKSLLLALRHEVMLTLRNHKEHLERSGLRWHGLPELTDAEGRFCSFSCPVQAWSSSTILDALYDLHRQVSPS